MSVKQQIAQDVKNKFAEIFQDEFVMDHCFESESHRRCRETGSVISLGYTGAENKDIHLCTITHGAKMLDHPRLAHVRRELVSRLLDLLLQDTPSKKNKFISTNQTVPVGDFIKQLLDQLDKYPNAFEFYAGVNSCPDSYADVLTIIALLKDAEKSDRFSIQISISSKSFKVVEPNDLFIQRE